MKFRHSTRESEIFLFSAKESDEEYYDVAYELTKNLFIGMAKRSLAFNSSKYEIYEPPFVFRERQLDTLIMPVLSTLCKGLAFAEYPMTRNSKKKGLEIEDSQGRIDYWCIYKDIVSLLKSSTAMTISKPLVQTMSAYYKDGEL